MEVSDPNEVARVFTQAGHFSHIATNDKPSRFLVVMDNTPLSHPDLIQTTHVINSMYDLPTDSWQLSETHEDWTDAVLYHKNGDQKKFSTQYHSKFMNAWRVIFWYLRISKETNLGQTQLATL